jgi:anti-sigma factor RsiW
MATQGHVSDRLSAWLLGRLDPAGAEEVSRHFASCTDCAEERDLLQQGHSLLRALPELEPRPGFAVRVAAAALEQRRPLSALVWRWAFGGLAGAAVAAGLLLTVSNNAIAPNGPSHEMQLAQRLELYEDLSVIQNREALENLDVVEQLDKLEVGKP